MMTFGKDAGLADLIFCMRLTELSPHDYELLTSRIQKLQGENFSAANVISIRNEQRAYVSSEHRKKPVYIETGVGFEL